MDYSVTAFLQHCTFSCNTEHEYSPVCDDETPSPKLDEAHEDAGDYESSDSGIYKTPKNECHL